MKWWQTKVAYELYPKSFLDTKGQGTGTIRGIIERLDYLASLGIGAVWITPVCRSPMVDNGYDIADYTDIDPSYGTMADMDELFARATERGIRIVIDLVFNHTSDQNPWFLESKKSQDNPYADWYIWRDAKEDGSAPTNWRGIFGGSAWTWCEERTIRKSEKHCTKPRISGSTGEPAVSVSMPSPISANPMFSGTERRMAKTAWCQCMT